MTPSFSFSTSQPALQYEVYDGSEHTVRFGEPRICHWGGGRFNITVLKSWAAVSDSPGILNLKTIHYELEQLGYLSYSSFILFHQL